MSLPIGYLWVYPNEYDIYLNENGTCCLQSLATNRRYELGLSKVLASLPHHPWDKVNYHIHDNKHVWSSVVYDGFQIDIYGETVEELFNNVAGLTCCAIDTTTVIEEEMSQFWSLVEQE